MKVDTRAGLLLPLALVLAACGSANAGEATTAATGAVAGGAGTGAVAGGAGTGAAGEIEMTDELRLMLGTMKLDEVGLAPDAVQASALLLLWQAYQSLAMSDTTAPVEIDAVLDQIEGTMTKEQLDAIAAMSLDEEDMAAFMDEFRQSLLEGGGEGLPGFDPQGGGLQGDFTPGQGPPDGFVPPEGGGAFGGGGFGGGGVGGGGGGFSPEQQATAEAGFSGRANGGFGSLFLLRPLIAELERLAGE